MRSGQIFLSAGAALLTITACIHAAGWFTLRGEVPVAVLPVVRMLWFSADLDWLVAAAVWALGAWAGSAASRGPIFAASLIPIGSALWLAVTVGPGFFGIYALALAALLAIMGGRRLGHT